MTDLAATRLIQADPILGKIIAEIEKPVIQSTHAVFHDLMSCILEQQIHYRSTKRIFAKALERAGITTLTPENFHLIEKYALPHLKLAQPKYETMLAVVDYWSNNNTDFSQLSDAAVATELSSMKGIGKWTIDMILLYTLERSNIFPFDDFHLKQILVSLYQLEPKVKLKAQMLEVAEKWGNQKSMAVLYLLEWKRRNKGL